MQNQICGVKLLKNNALCALMQMYAHFYSYSHLLFYIYNVLQSILTQRTDINDALHCHHVMPPPPVKKC